MAAYRLPLMNASPLPTSVSAPSARDLRFARRTGILCALVLLAGCASDPTPSQPLDTPKYTLENTERVTVFDRATQDAISCTGLLEYPLGDGRLEVVATLKNRSDHRVDLQSSCVFKDAQGLTTVEETAWKNVTLAEHASEAVRFSASNPSAKKYTIRLRQTH